MSDTDKSQPQQATKKQKSYHTKATGPALATVKAHSQEQPLKLYGSCFCPFVQRVWISLEHKHLPYQYIEIDPYKKPQQLLDINPRGLVPALRHGDWGMYESTVLMEYLEDLSLIPADDGGASSQSGQLLPSHPQQRARARLWADHVNRSVIPGFYRVLQAQEADKQAAEAKQLAADLAKLVDAADTTGPFFSGGEFGFVDACLAPWALRFSRVLSPYRGWPAPEPGSRWGEWLKAMEGTEAVKRTTSSAELYLDSYERYAENRPGTSQVADAINSGRGLP